MKNNRFLLAVLAVTLFTGLWAEASAAKVEPNVPAKYKKFFYHYVDQRTYLEKTLNAIGLTQKDLGRSFALIAGVSHYPHLSQPDLKPAAEDIKKLKNYLRQVEFFDEIIVLENENMTDANLKFFLQAYLPRRLKQFPKSRCLFAYSGHGFTQGNKGYLLLSQARSMSDKSNSTNMAMVRVLFNEVVASGHQVLALINACYGGSFLNRSFGKKLYFQPEYDGAHAITAGGADEPAWHDSDVGSGSIFFEKFFEGLNGYADSLPKAKGGDGVVTVSELYAFLEQEIQDFTDQKQNPHSGDLRRGGSSGGFFFLNRHRQVELGYMQPWNPNNSIAYGSSTPTVTAAPTRKPTPQPSEIPAPVTPPVKLRDNPKALSKDDVKAMLKRHNFLDKEWNQSGDFENDFKDNGNGTVTDRRTGLMWQKGGSENYMKFKDADEYVRQVNQKRLGDYTDWRLPTLEELASLIETKKMNGDLYIDPVFDKNQRWCWSADPVEGSSELAWVVDFVYGLVYNFSLSNDDFVRVVRAGQ